jgi:hypothetical protein
MDFIYTYSDYQKQHQPDQALVGRMASLAMRQLQAALSQPYTGHEVAVTIPCLDPNLTEATKAVVSLVKDYGHWNVIETSYSSYNLPKPKREADIMPHIKDLFKLDEMPLIGGRFYCLTLRVAL